MWRWATIFSAWSTDIIMMCVCASTAASTLWPFRSQWSHHWPASGAIPFLHQQIFHHGHHPQKVSPVGVAICVVNNESHWYRIYQFIGHINRNESPQFGELFSHYQNIKVPFLEIPGSLKESQLHVWPSHPDKTPQFFAWLTGAGVYYGKLEFEDQKPGDSLFSEKNLIPYDHGQHSEVTPPVGMALTQFHCMLLYRDRWVCLWVGVV